MNNKQHILTTLALEERMVQSPCPYGVSLHFKIFIKTMRIMFTMFLKSIYSQIQYGMSKIVICKHIEVDPIIICYHLFCNNLTQPLTIYFYNKGWKNKRNKHWWLCPDVNASPFSLQYMMQYMMYFLPYKGELYENVSK